MLTKPQPKNCLPQSNLPLPDAAALAHSQRLSQLIQAEINQQGSINFARFMELALYAPGLGYYSAGSRKFGRQGDFITAPDLSPLFAQCIARQCEQILKQLTDGDILEFGAGSGNLAVELMLALAAQQCLPKHYFILEVSADLRQRQQQLLAQRIPQWFERFIWLDNLPASLNGVVLANEVIDAMPVHRFKIQNGIQEFYVTYENEQFVWQLSPAANPRLLQPIKDVTSNFSESYESEVNLLLEPWLTEINHFLQQGLILLIDYGFPRHEYYHPHRNGGTLMCHYQHRAHSDPLVLPGLQDITAHVDFTQVAEVADKLGLTVAGFTQQANFLLSCGLMEFAANPSADPASQWTMSQQIKMLTMPSEMGELFKVMALTRNIAEPLLGFNWHDDRARL